jgi:hypothetical protein
MTDPRSSQPVRPSGLVFIEDNLDTSRDYDSGENTWPNGRTAGIATSIALLSTAALITVIIFLVNDPDWVKWGVGLILAFNILVAARLALSTRAARRPTAD